MQAHGPIGITIASLAYAQLVLAVLRPKPDSPIRSWWNLQHWITGRVVVLLAAINILIGVQVTIQTNRYSTGMMNTAM